MAVRAPTALMRLSAERESGPAPVRGSTGPGQGKGVTRMDELTFRVRYRASLVFEPHGHDGPLIGIRGERIEFEKLDEAAEADRG